MSRYIGVVILEFTVGITLLRDKINLNNTICYKSITLTAKLYLCIDRFSVILIPT